MNRRPRHRAALAVALGAALLDLATKAWAYAAVPYGESRPLLGDWFLIHPRSNPAGPWSWGHGILPEPVLRFLLPAVSVVAVVILLRILRGTDPLDRVKALGLALILGGAAGNLWDRTFFALDPAHGGVRDFLLLPRVVFGGPFPAFNLADTWITVGVAMVAWRLLFERPEPEGDGAAAGAGDPGEVRA